MEVGRGADAILVLAGLAAVTLTSAVAAYRALAAGDVVSMAFVGISYSTLLLLFHSLGAYERLPRLMNRREVWALSLSTLLTVLLAWKVAAAMPSWPVAAAVWAMAVLITAGGFVAMFCRRHP
ncbi:hypothetical protein U9M48_029837 [Paspalum notatum var. saurae]|uniref:Uncharacterized protein n=1 Tax=Paspalum notatum var. saurae TaxID=547442 RepID=A0AAQ3X345_PASNO